MSEIREKAATEYGLAQNVLQTCKCCGEDTLWLYHSENFKSGYDYAKRNDPDVKALVDALELALHFFDSVEKQVPFEGKIKITEAQKARSAISAYRKAIEGEK